ncbi:MAG: UDP-N-acetylmuramoyl-L-alanine--D-glutamate ligase [Bacillota bacterium]|nr:UDP-N-acetylmuramoyl-L-alanine--D-glutamate ligase [Bacillota bacterium]
MDEKKILIIGYGKSGRAAASAMTKLGWQVYVYDDFLKDLKLSYQDKGINFIYDSSQIFTEEFNLYVKSPGIKPNNPLIKSLKDQGKKIISDIELGYLFKGPEKIIGVTGTNGKTTTTSFIDYFLKKTKIKTKAVGNIGYGAVEDMIFTDKDILTIECSSFQLEDIDTFKANIAVITNVESDHLDYHGSLAAYIQAKVNILKNLGQDDFAILNFDDPILKKQDGNFKKIYFSSKTPLDSGFYCDGHLIYLIEDQKKKALINCQELIVKGSHNYENLMAGLAVAYALGLDLDLVIEAAYSFTGVKHRLEFVREYKGVAYYNDSKATNSASTKKAVEAFSRPLILLLGGYDKNEDFTELLKTIKDKIKVLIIYGQTKDKIFAIASDLAYEKIFKVDNLEAALIKAYDLAEENDLVLLSPASASWDQYKNFEDRGDEFINLVNKIK